MTLTPQDRETIRGAARLRNAFHRGKTNKRAEEMLTSLLSILDRLAAEDNAEDDRSAIERDTIKVGAEGSKKILDALDNSSSPLPDDICARCGKRYGMHHGQYCDPDTRNNNKFLSSSDKPERDEPENCPEFWQKEINRLTAEVESLKVSAGLVDAKIAAAEEHLEKYVDKRLLVAFGDED